MGKFAINVTIDIEADTAKDAYYKLYETLDDALVEEKGFLYWGSEWYMDLDDDELIQRDTEDFIE